VTKEGERVVVRLELDFLVEAGFYYLGRWPIALMDAITGGKEAAFRALEPNPLDPESLITSANFSIDKRTFLVTFGADKAQYRQCILRVMAIQP
jgi:hypothetical protein